MKIIIDTSEEIIEYIKNNGCLSTGKWVVDIIGYKGDKTTSMRFKCSNCGTIISWIPGEKYPTKESFLDAHPWCFCGAKMKGGDNE